ncbi:amino acid ABC transporter permease [uncultured Microbacterium sp.]|uniref:amino acid ABC transporter permease n=1 Tax=uncultured Microbacterium sp. TaxID=191216 RepID=UPI00260E2353|nr:amino acid ABC transporter permease [uncultured Microbacterium sp.]
MTDLDRSRDDLTVVPARYPGRWAAAVVMLVIAALIGISMVANERFGWDVVAQYLFAPPIVAGLMTTLMLTGASMLIGIVLGILLAVGRLSPNPIVAGAAWLYSWFFRGTPLLVQLLFWFFLSALYPKIVLGVPFGPEWLHFDTNSLITPLTAALLGLSLNEGAYMSEIVRAGIIAVPRGQTEAAEAIGMTRMQAMFRVVLPQAMRVIIPPTGNEVIGMLKNTSLVLVIGYSELMTATQSIYARTFETIPMLIVAAIWYLVMTAVLSIAQHYIEKRVGRGFEQTVRVQKPAMTVTEAIATQRRVKA